MRARPWAEHSRMGLSRMATPQSLPVLTADPPGLGGQPCVLVLAWHPVCDHLALP